MKSHEALKAAIDHIGPKQVAAELGVSLSLVYKWIEDPGESGTKNPLDRVDEILRATKHPAPIAWLCESVDGVFVRNPPAKPHAEMDVLRETQRVLREFSDVLDAVSQAMSDGKLAPDEAKKIRREWEELKATGEALVRACEARVVDDEGKRKRS